MAEAITSPVSVQRLPNGNTFIASDQAQIREVDRTGKEMYVIQQVPGNPRTAYRLARGLIVCLTSTGECVLMDTTGKRHKSFATHHAPDDVAGIDLAPNGRILVAQHRRGKVVEYDTEGKKILELDAPRGDGDEPAQRPHSRGQLRQPSRLRVGSLRQDRLGTQERRPQLAGAATVNRRYCRVGRGTRPTKAHGGPRSSAHPTHLLGGRLHETTPFA